MKSRYLSLLFFFTLAISINAQTRKSQAATWHDTTRDVFIDNELDRKAQVLTADNPTRLALISAKLDRAIVLDVSEKAMLTMAASAFHFDADRTSAASDAGVEMQTAGKFTRIDGPIYSFAVGGQPVLIRPHPGFVGELTTDKLWETVPVWQAKADAYTPDPKGVAALKAVDKDAKVTVIFGTWCGDSKHYVPQLLRALREAGNSKLQVKLIGVDSQFHEPVDTVQPRQLTNVPTVIVERDGHEIGRIVETPAVDTIEQDLADILNGKPNSNPGRWDRAAKLASGKYQYRNAGGKPCGSETWEIFATAEGGHLIHSRITGADNSIEVFYRASAQGVPTFVEITRQGAETRDRTRINIDGHTLTARMRGSATGIVQQTLELPQGAAVSTPAHAAEGLPLATADAAQGRSLVYYQTPVGAAGAMGTIGSIGIEGANEQSIRVPAGEFHVRHLTMKGKNGANELWLHSQLNVPVRGRVDQVEFVLESIEVASTPK